MWYTTLWVGSYLPLQWGVVIGASLVAVFYDVRFHRIPNWLTGPLVLSGLGWSVAVGGLRGLEDAACAMAICALPFVLLFLFAGGGAGDAKLMGGVGSWLGMVGGLWALMGVVVAGIVVGLIYSACKKRITSVLYNVSQIVFAFGWRMLGGLRGQGKTESAVTTISQQDMIQMPYGVAILLGVCLAAAGTCLWRVTS